jgi:hypothetical protein
MLAERAETNDGKTYEKLSIVFIVRHTGKISRKMTVRRSDNISR